MILAPERLRALLGAYPPERQHALAVFQDIQKDCGYLPQQHIVEAAQYLQMPLSQAYAMATFYHAFSLTPRGKHIIKVCDGTACHMCGSSSLLVSIKQVLGIGPDELTADGLFSLECVNCVGSCALAPVMLIDGNYYAKVNTEKLITILEGYQPGGEHDE